MDDANKTYDPEEYRKFRIESPLSLAFNFAHDANAKAINLLFLYYTEELVPHWLEVLDNMPECVPPSSYKLVIVDNFNRCIFSRNFVFVYANYFSARKLLPKFNEQHQLESWQCKRIRPAEWSESGEFK